MDKIEKIRKEIAQLKGVKLYTFSDILSEEPDKSLEEAAEKYLDIVFGKGKHQPFYKELFIAGAKWQAEKCDEETSKLLYAERKTAYIYGWDDHKEQMLKEAVEGYVNYYEDSGGILMAEAQVGCPYHNGDKVRIIVLPKEEQI